MAAAYRFLLLTNTRLGSIINIVNGGSRTADGVDAICGYFFRGKLNKK